MLLTRIEHAARGIEDYEYQRNSETEIFVYRRGGQGLDVLTISAAQAEGGTRLEVNGRSEPHVIAAIRKAPVTAQ